MADDNIEDLSKYRAIKGRETDGGSGGGSMDLEARVNRLEENVADIRTDVAAIRATMDHLATKSDVKDIESSTIKWLIGTMLGAAGIAAAIAFGLARLLAS